MATIWTLETAVATKWTQLEPIGFGLAPFGDASDLEAGLKIHSRGFGDPSTKWTEYDGG